jgi:hypothetical protein
VGDLALRAIPGPRRYCITPWPVRILAPVLALVVILTVAADNDAPAVTIPIVLILGGLYIFAAERCGLYADDSGLESRMTRRANSFRYAWSEIDQFELIQGGAQLAIVIHLADGTSRIPLDDRVEVRPVGGRADLRPAQPRTRGGAIDGAGRAILGGRHRGVTTVPSPLVGPGV